MRISAVAPWYGSKRTLAPKIIEQLGPHKAYWEPFCGSLSVLLAKESVTYETVNDLHSHMVNLALVLQSESSAKDLYARAERTLFHEELCRMAKAHVSKTADADPFAVDVDRAYWFLVFSWFGINGIAGTHLHRTGSMCVRFSAKGGNGATRWRSVVDSIPAWHERLLRVQITSRDAIGLLEEIDDADGTAIYCDPPYILKKSRYVHDFDAEDHARLAEVLGRFRKARVVVSYYDHPALDDLYRSWTKIDSESLSVAKSMTNSGMRDQGRKDAPEVLFVNGCLFSSSESLF